MWDDEIEDIKQSNKTMSEYKTVSFSGLESYKTCPQLFSYKYIEKLAYEQPLQKALLVGSWTHKMVEGILINPETTAEDHFKTNINNWCIECKVDLEYDQLESLIDLSINLKELLYRASSFCNDDTKIRNSNGTVLKSPVDYPSTSFKTELAKLPCYRYKAQLDQVACQKNEAFLDMSFSWLFAEALYNASMFKFPSWAEKTLFTELAFGTTEHNQVPLSEGSKGGLLGYIDWIVKMKDGRVAIIDHKTSTKCPTNEEVLFHPQLNLYAYAYKMLYGNHPDIIGINHIKSGRVILAEVMLNVVYETVEYYSSIYDLSQKGEIYKKHPNDYQSPCVKRDYNSDKIINVCPYLDKCWETYSKVIKV